MLEKKIAATGRETIKHLLQEIEFNKKIRWADAIELVESEDMILMQVHFPTKEERRALWDEEIRLRTEALRRSFGCMKDDAEDLQAYINGED